MTLPRLLLTALCALGLCAAAPADEPAPWAKPFAGRWTLSGAGEGDPVCGLALGAGLAIGGASAQVSATCRRNYPLEDVAGWRMQGRAIVLIDVLRKALFTFEPGPDKAWSASLAPGKLVFLERGAPEAPASLKVLFGDDATFTLSGPDNAGACGFALTAPTASSGALTQEGRCAAPWKGRGWSSWTAQGDALQLKDTKGAVILSLKRADEYSFSSATPKGPIFFGPGVIDGSDQAPSATAP